MGWRQRLGGIAWIIAAIYFVVQPVVAAAWPRAYSWTGNYISDLGAVSCAGPVCSPRHALMNAGFVVTGLAIVGGLALLWPFRPAGRRSALGLVFIAVGGLGNVVVGVFPADIAVVVHSAGALVHIPLQGVGLLLVGLAAVRDRRRFGVYTLVCAAAALLGAVMFFSGQHGALGTGGAERLADYPFVLWIVLTGLLATRRRSTNADQEPR